MTGKKGIERRSKPPDTVQTSKHTLPHEHTESAAASLSARPCYTYTERVQRIHQLPPHIPECDPSPLRCSWIRPAVAALAASRARPPHFNASDIYLGRTTGGTGGGGRPRTTPADVDSPAVNLPHSTPPTPPTLYSFPPLGCVFFFFCSGDHVFQMIVSSM